MDTDTGRPSGGSTTYSGTEIIGGRTGGHASALSVAASSCASGLSNTAPIGVNGSSRAGNAVHILESMHGGAARLEISNSTNGNEHTNSNTNGIESCDEIQRVGREGLNKSG